MPVKLWSLNSLGYWDTEAQGEGNKKELVPDRSYTGSGIFYYPIQFEVVIAAVSFLLLYSVVKDTFLLYYDQEDTWLNSPEFLSRRSDQPSLWCIFCEGSSKWQVY